MATIFEKLPASGEKCLVLEPKELLIYPFDFGSGWTHIRLGTFHSYTSIYGYNDGFIAEQSYTSTPAGSFYYGFMYSPNDELPYSNNTIFMGVAGMTGLSQYVILNVNSGPQMLANSNSTPLWITQGQLTGYAPPAFSSTLLHGQTALLASGDTVFAGGAQVIFEVNTGAKTYRLSTNAGTSIINPTANTTTAILRSSMANYAISNTYTGYYTTNFTSTGDLLPMPNKAVIYSPFVLSRLRIHNLVVEKYA